jgi:hypothetical protein
MPMPYTLGKGPVFTLLENVLNPTTADETTVRNEALLALRSGTPIIDVPWVTSAPVAAVPLPTAGTLAQRLERDWFGGATATAVGTGTGQATGYWVGYTGDVESVLREGIIRAMEVSMGLTHGAAPNTATRAWPVQIEWKCPNPYFEIWVTWRRHEAQTNKGQVTMIVATPPDKYNRLVTDPLYPPEIPDVSPVPTPLEAPQTADDPQGMWLIAHEHHVQHTIDQLVDVPSASAVGAVLDTVSTLLGLPKHQWHIPMPTTHWEDTGEVVVVSPPAYAGGVDPSRSNTQ